VWGSCSLECVLYMKLTRYGESLRSAVYMCIADRTVRILVTCGIGHSHYCLMQAVYSLRT
jgi:hypothetical protein